MAKRLDAHYSPGQRSPAWRKIKPRQEDVGVIIGYRTRPDRSLAALLLVGQQVSAGSALGYVGQIRGGWSGAVARRLERLLAERRCDQPCVPCTKHALD